MGLSYRVYVGPYVKVTLIKGVTDPSLGYVSDEIREQMYWHELSDGTVLWFPNVERDPPRVFGFNPTEGQHFDLDLGMLVIRDEVDWLYKNFTEEIIKLRDIYGDECVSVSWGIVSMIS